MRIPRLLVALAALVTLSLPAAAQTAIRWRAVLVAGDPSLPVWDNATRAMAERLTAANIVVPGQVTRLSARPQEAGTGARPGGLQAAIEAIQGMRPAAGEGCLVFLTMHGAQNAGLVFVPGNQVLTPNLLDKVLQLGCGAAPTLVVASGCFTGDFATGNMARDNRVVLTAARPDRSSFGCGAGFELTVFDDCLLQSLEQGGPMLGIRERTRACVSAEETRRRVSPPSEPAAHLGAAMRALALPPMPGASSPAPPAPRRSKTG
ncbi:hypothetical protein G3576_23245 [Roseomonas stagni]|uniref:Peptidase C13 n=1 Tax=Falsiroseomonas algicola TaxID=2716930 RepID=A0A6M1LRV5_9PROT|nr:C13 family peptidase [Falsiroseomonas algicola]NGM22947.1 hypothetical protein [Falsiroseomonas algicola]